ncbi:hypothetical protein RI367_004167 [Sorochytrium milnesiophthora]
MVGNGVQLQPLIVVPPKRTTSSGLSVKSLSPRLPTSPTVQQQQQQQQRADITDSLPPSSLSPLLPQTQSLVPSPPLGASAPAYSPPLSPARSPPLSPLSMAMAANMDKADPELDDSPTTATATTNPSHLFWVPAHQHPEVAPQAFKDWLSRHDFESHKDAVSRVQRRKSYRESSHVVSADKRGSLVVEELTPHEEVDGDGDADAAGADGDTSPLAGPGELVARRPTSLRRAPRTRPRRPRSPSASRDGSAPAATPSDDVPPSVAHARRVSQKKKSNLADSVIVAAGSDDTPNVPPPPPPALPAKHQTPEQQETALAGSAGDAARKERPMSILDLQALLPSDGVTILPSLSPAPASSLAASVPERPPKPFVTPRPLPQLPLPTLPPPTTPSADRSPLPISVPTLSPATPPAVLQINPNVAVDFVVPPARTTSLKLRASRPPESRDSPMPSSPLTPSSTPQPAANVPADDALLVSARDDVLESPVASVEAKLDALLQSEPSIPPLMIKHEPVETAAPAVAPLLDTEQLPTADSATTAAPNTDATEPTASHRPPSLTSLESIESFESLDVNQLAEASPKKLGKKKKRHLFGFGSDRKSSSKEDLSLVSADGGRESAGEDEPRSPSAKKGSSWWHVFKSDEDLSGTGRKKRDPASSAVAPAAQDKLASGGVNAVSVEGGSTPASSTAPHPATSPPALLKKPKSVLSLFKSSKSKSSSSGAASESGAATGGSPTSLTGVTPANRAAGASGSGRTRYTNYSRYPIHIERAVCRLAHQKLANPRRPLHHQVLISNMLVWYMSLRRAEEMGQQGGQPLLNGQGGATAAAANGAGVNGTAATGGGGSGAQAANGSPAGENGAGEDGTAAQVNGTGHDSDEPDKMVVWKGGRFRSNMSAGGNGRSKKGRRKRKQNGGGGSREMAVPSPNYGAIDGADGRASGFSFEDGYTSDGRKAPPQSAAQRHARQGYSDDNDDDDDDEEEEDDSSSEASEDSISDGDDAAASGEKRSSSIKYGARITAPGPLPQQVNGTHAAATTATAAAVADDDDDEDDNVPLGLVLKKQDPNR